MSEQPEPDPPMPRPAPRHRRPDGPLVVAAHRPRPRPPRTVPRPSLSALLGVAVLLLVAAGAFHLTSRGGVVPEAAPPLEVTTTSGRATPGTTAPAAVPPPAPTLPDEAAQEGGPTPAAASPTGDVVVHVSGAVDSPGVVELPAGSRVDDALRAAGGAGDDADLDGVNLARPLVDGEQIHVPVPGESPRPASSPPAGPAPAPGEAGGATGDAPIDLNTASAGELEELPGVGPAIAERIIAHREQNGAFTSVDQLEEVPGIGPATLEKIRDRATV